MCFIEKEMIILWVSNVPIKLKGLAVNVLLSACAGPRPVLPSCLVGLPWPPRAGDGPRRLQAWPVPGNQAAWRHPTPGHLAAAYAN